MTDTFDRRSSNRVRAQLERARSAGAWMPWMATLMAVGVWGAVVAYVYLNIGLQAVFAQPPLALAGQVGLLIVPGLALICAGVMARESRRSAEANALVLTSARLLLEPADRAREEISSIAEAVARETQFVNKSLGETRGKLDGLRADIEQSVTSALKAAEIVRADSEVLVSRMSAERKSLQELSEALKQQAGDMAKAIPLHAQLISEAARVAHKELVKADDTLDQRLRGVDEAARRLAERIDQLDTMGAESRKRAQNLAGALARMDEQLVQSTRMVDAAVKAGELATAASKSTADALRDAMSDALDAALKTSETIADRSAAASDSARDAMTRLKEAGQQAEATTKGAAMAARAHAEETEQRIARMNDMLHGASNRAVAAAENGLERAKSRIERASLLLHTIQDERPEAKSSIDDLAASPAAPEPAPAPAGLSDARPEAPLPPPRAEPRSQPKREFRLELRQEALRPAGPKPTASADFASAMRDAPAPEATLRNAPQPDANDAHRLAPSRNGNGVSHAPPHAMQPLAAPEPMIELRPDMIVMRPTPLPPHVVGEDTPGLSWRDLLTGIEDVEQPPRDDTASSLIDRLDRAGVRLNRAVRASDLRRIAVAAHQGERQRRRATRDINPAEIQRVARLLDADRDLQQAARRFVAVEEPDALRALASSERAREDAAPRLSAYLLLDAALGAVL